MFIRYESGFKQMFAHIVMTGNPDCRTSLDAKKHTAKLPITVSVAMLTPSHEGSFSFIIIFL